MDLLIQPKWMISPDFKPIRDPTIVIEGHTIVEITEKGDLPASRGHERIVIEKGLLCPALVNAHTHLPESLLRGICDDKSLHEWLYNYIWKVEPHMTNQDAKVGAMLGCAEQIAFGCVGFIDQYFYASEVAEAAFETGMKAFVFPSIFEGNPESETIERSFKKAKEVYSDWNGKNEQIYVGFGPHAPYTVDPKEELAEIAATAAALGTRIHTHLHESSRELKEAKEKWGVTPIEKLAELGILKRCLAAHCVHVTDKDIELLREARVTILHCPQSNLKTGSGIAPIPDFLSANLGENICLGTDGQASNNNLDILEEVMLTALIHKGVSMNPTAVKATDALKMATSNPAKIFPNGSFCRGIRPGEKADLVVFDLNKPHLTPIIDPISNLVYSAHGNDVTLTLSNGRILFQDGRFYTLNIEEILKSAANATQEMCTRAGLELDF